MTPPTMAEIRRAAYATVAAAMGGAEYPGDDIWTAALAVVVSDERKSRSAAERALQRNVITSMVLLEAVRSSSSFAQIGRTIGDTLRAMLGDDEEVKP